MRSLRACAPKPTVWVAIFALALNALVPVHLVFDMTVAAAAHEPRADLRAPSLMWRALAVLTGHLPDGREPGHRSGRHQAPCPVCASAAILAGFVSAGAPVLPGVIGQPVSNPLSAGQAFVSVRPVASYHSRAPPFV